MVDEKRTIGVIQVLNKKTDTDVTFFTEQDVVEVQKIAMLISDSFYRQRWVALEYGASLGDQEALSIIEKNDERPNMNRMSTMHGSRLSVRSAPCSPTHIRSDHAIKSHSVSNPGISPSGESDQVPGFALTSPEASVTVTEVASMDLTEEPSTGPLTLFAWPQRHRRAQMEKLRSLSFNALDSSTEELTRLVPLIMEDTGCTARCSVPSAALKSWVSAARSLYRDNPFHSWFHGFSVFQMCYFQVFISTSQLHQSLRNVDIFGLLVAALCHDLDHPGFTNSYLVDEESELALRYNDVSVLENHHASVACGLLRGDDTRIGSGMNLECQKTLRRIVIKCILDTDMSHHHDLCQRILLSNNNECELDQQFALSATIHTSDLSAQVLPWRVASQWEERISREFASQAAAERRAGRTPAPFMQFKPGDLRQRGKLQRDFIDFVLIPLWGPYVDLITELSECYENLLKNREKYDRRFTKEATEASSLEASEH